MNTFDYNTNINTFIEVACVPVSPLSATIFFVPLFSFGIIFLMLRNVFLMLELKKKKGNSQENILQANFLTFQICGIFFFQLKTQNMQ